MQCRMKLVRPGERPTSDGTLYQNYIFPEGGTIYCDEGITVTLTPSKMIQSENYYEDYMNSY